MGILRGRWRAVQLATVAAGISGLALAAVLPTAGAAQLVPRSRQTRAGGLGASANVTIGYDTGGDAIDFFVAKEHHLFQKFGLKPHYVAFSSGAAATTALKSGSVDIVVTGLAGVISADLAGANAKVIYESIDQSGGLWLVASPGSGVTSLNGFKGKTIGTLTGSDAWIALEAMLKAHGMQSSVNVTDVSPPAWVPSLTHNEVAGVVSWPVLAQVLVADGGHKIMSLANSGAPLSIDVFWEARASYLRSHRAAVTAWARAMDAANAWARAHKTASAKLWSTQTGAPLSASLAGIAKIHLITSKEMLSKTSQYSMQRNGGMSKDWHAYIHFLRAGKIFPSIPRHMTRSIDPYFVRAAAKR